MNTYTVYLYECESEFDAIELGFISLGELTSFLVDADSIKEALENANAIMEIDESYDDFHIYKIV